MGASESGRAAGAAEPSGAGASWPGRRLGIDVGSVRIGVSVCDPDGILASPVATLSRDQARGRDRDQARDRTESNQPPSDMARIAEFVRDYEIVEIIVGLPVTLAGSEGIAAASIRQYAEHLSKLVDPVPVLFSDERMSTVAAARRLSERGVRGRRQRSVVDQAAAVEILQGWLDKRRRRT